MSENNVLPATDETWKYKTMALGAVIGAVAGLVAAYLLIQRSEKEGTAPKLTAGEGVKLGALVFGLLRQVSQLGK